MCVCVCIIGKGEPKVKCRNLRTEVGKETIRPSYRSMHTRPLLQKSNFIFTYPSSIVFIRDFILFFAQFEFCCRVEVHIQSFSGV